MRCRVAALAGTWIVLLLLPGAGAVAGGMSGAFSGIRPYLQLRYAHEDSMYNYTDPNGISAVHLLSPSQEHAFGGSLGADIGRYLGVEFALDYSKTDLNEPSGTKAGDFSSTMFLGQLRFRWPLMHDRLVPYALIGGGMGLGEFSGRKDFTFPVRASDWAPLGVAGGGVEYFFARNLALGLEAKYFFGYHPDVQVAGVTHSLTADAVEVTAGLRVYFDSLATGEHARPVDSPPPMDNDQMRFYIALRGGKALFTDPDHLSNPTIDRTSGILGNAAVGMNFNGNWGAELAFEYTRAQLRSPTLGRVSGYPVGSIEALARFRYPVFNRRVSPYLLAGPGLAFGQGGDPDQPVSVTGFTAGTDWTPVAVFGGGVEYFLEDNVAVGVELKDVTFFDTTIRQNGVPMKLSPNFLSYSAGVRIFF